MAETPTINIDLDKLNDNQLTFDGMPVRLISLKFAGSLELNPDTDAALIDRLRLGAPVELGNVMVQATQKSQTYKMDDEGGERVERAIKVEVTSWDHDA